ncbi:phage tail tape measure protein [Bacillus sp. 1P02SD]|uniref:phage tail tape measure protein n=1 Tax=Bacillus sp. 1P02SD TaxID=3132264 RepID=UPI00399F9AD7
MSLLGNLTVGILGNMGGLSNTFKQAQSEVEKFGKKMESVGKDLTSIGSSLTMMVTAPIVAVGGSATKLAIDFESAFAGVRKTVDATETELALFKQGIRDLAKEIPIAATEIAGIAEAAGQLGIKNEAILGFTRVMADLGVATNMSSTEAATALARLANITQMPQENFDRLGSVIVALGNNLATTESEIVEMGLRLAGAGKQVGMSEAQILAFSGALSSVGIEAEAGGSAFSKVMVEMQLAAEKGGKGLDNFAKVAGMSAGDFQKAYKEDAAGAMIKFIEGLSTAEERGLSAIGILDEMGITEVRLRDSLLRAAGASDVFTGALDLGTQAWEENNALTKEASERYKTTESQLKIFWNRIKDIGITIGDALIPALLSTLDAMDPLIKMLERAAEWFKNLNPGIQTAIIAMAAIAAAIGPVLVVAGMLISSVGSIVTAFAGLSGALAGVGGIMGIITGPIGLTVLAVVGLGAALIALWKNSETFRENVIGIFNKVKDTAIQAFGIIASFVGEKIAQIKKFWDQNGAQFLAAVENVFNGIMAVVEFVMPAIKFLIEMVWTAIKQVINGALNVIMGVIKIFSGLFTGDFSKMWEGIKQLFFGAIDVIIGWMTLTFVGGLRTLLTNLLKTGLNLVKGLADGIVNFFKSFSTTGQNLAKGLVDNVVNFFLNLQSSISIIFNSIRSLGASIWNAIKNTIVEIAKIIWDLVASRFTSMVSSIRNIFGTVRSTISSIWDNVMSFFRGINLTKIGADIIRGLINGIGSMASAVWEKAKSIASGIGSTIKNVLGIRSPSRVLMGLGEFAGEGLALGMDGMLSKIQSSAKAMANAAIPNIAPIDMSLNANGGRGSSPGTNGASPFNIVIQPAPVYLDDYLIGEIMLNHVDNRLNTNAQMLQYMKGER